MVVHLPKKKYGHIESSGFNNAQTVGNIYAPCSSAVLRILPSVARGGVEKHTYLYHIPRLVSRNMGAGTVGFSGFFRDLK